MPWTTADIPDLSSRTVVVTGANGGLGLETTRALAEKGAHVVMAARNAEKAAAAVEDVRSSAPEASLEVVPLDRTSSIDILVNNAGVMGIPERKTVDGFEMQFGVDHLGHWTLTALLMPALLAADRARVVTVTSTAHHMGRAVDPDNPHLDGKYGPWKAYGQAKLANFHFALGLQQDFEHAGVAAESLVAHPGLSNTELQAVSVEETGGGFSQRFFLWAARNTGMAAAQGALSQLRAATDPAAKGGEFYGPLWVNNGPPVRKPIVRRIGMERAISRLWETSETETGVALDIRRGAAAAA